MMIDVSLFFAKLIDCATALKFNHHIFDTDVINHASVWDVKIMLHVYYLLHIYVYDLSQRV